MTTTDWIAAIIVLAMVALIVTTTVLLMRRRERMRAAAREAESLNVLSNDTRRAFWISAADRSDASESTSCSGDGDDGE